ncbi:unnamed protein product [Cylindrotheca closterium]|uniref:Uncharacterized protein n=1 Tax=Cylindrotheca closterium TaxID=2856 RepID=A0AAD2CT62_9STRA|nr:unnamed protein product [Cylindrotheca closterium]
MAFRRFTMVAFAAFVGVKSFTIMPCLQYMNRRSCRPTSPRLFDTSSNTDSSDDAPSTSKKVEFWLDLRETAILPTAALEFLRENLSDDDEDSPCLEIDIDRILVATNKAQAYREISDEDFIQPALLYVSKDNDSELCSTKDGVTESFGEIVAMNGSAGVENPLKVIQTLSSGKWIVLVQRCNEKDVEESMLNTVGDFLEIASNSISGSWLAALTSDSPLAYPSKDLVVPHSQEMGEGTNGAGVAIKCSSSTSLMQLASSIEFSGSGMSTTMLDSGILIQDVMTDKRNLPIALLLPFDVSIWRVANTLYANRTE